jgi:hypothetical protein
MKNLMTKTSIALGLALNLTACDFYDMASVFSSEKIEEAKAAMNAQGGGGEEPKDGIDDSLMDNEEAMMGTALLSLDEASISSPVVTPIEPPYHPHP